jgi:hypothetical protein
MPAIPPRLLPIRSPTQKLLLIRRKCEKANFFSLLNDMCLQREFLLLGSILIASITGYEIVLVP